MTTPDKIIEMLDDKRPIDYLGGDIEHGAWYPSPEFEIEVYGEPGMYCNLPYFAVKKEGVIVARIPAWQISVHYK